VRGADQARIKEECQWMEARDDCKKRIRWGPGSQEKGTGKKGRAQTGPSTSGAAVTTSDLWGEGLGERGGKKRGKTPAGTSLKPEGET